MQKSALQSHLKPALSFEQQIEKLKSRGMHINDEAKALEQLSSISYYRLSGYWYPFLLRDNNKITHQFEANTSFDTVISLYEFDRKLRGLVLDAIERIEVALRTQFTYHLGHQYGAFAHTDKQNFHPQFNHAKWIAKLEEETTRARDEFIKHYQQKYQGFPTIPIWMLTEVISLGGLSFGYNGLINNQQLGIQDKKTIAQFFNVHHKRLGDWLHSLTYVRNVCAHHSRLWNRELAIRPDRSKEPEWLPPFTPRNDRIFYILLILRHLQRATNNGDEWATIVNQVITPIASEKRWRIAMGIPENWQRHPLWC